MYTTRDFTIIIISAKAQECNHKKHKMFQIVSLRIQKQSQTGVSRICFDGEEWILPIITLN